MKKGKLSVIREYFGTNGQALAQFSAEVKALSEQDKLELAQGAAKNLGYTQDDLDFPAAA